MGSVSRFDITKAKGLITLAENYEIASTTAAEVNQNWGITITFVNLTSNQNENAGKVFNAEIRMQKEAETNLLADYIKRLYTTDGENGLYLHDADLVNGANDGSYRYAGANPNNYVCFGYDDTSKGYASNWCPNDNLYRIIRVFGDHVKLIKYDYATSTLLGEDGEYVNTYNIEEWGTSDTYIGHNANIYTYCWDNKNWKQAQTETGYRNIWSYSELNKINLNNIGETWSNLITGTTWKVGAIQMIKLSIHQ